MKLVVGLGNIGKEYEKTNHNAGFMVLDEIAKKVGFSFKNRGCEADYAEVNVQGEKFIVAKPRTFMNESGKAVKSLISKFKIDIQDVFIIASDFYCLVNAIYLKFGDLNISITHTVVITLVII